MKGEQLISGEDDLPEGFEHWMVKFSAKADMRDAGPIEFAYAEMAKAAGIDLPETKLFKVAKSIVHFGLRRFDRGPGNSRFHVHTFGNLIHSNFRVPSADYADLMKVTSALTRNYQDLLRAFRRMVFNIAAHNRDDHAKNFAFIMNEAGEWSLSPAYDLDFATGPGGEHTMTVMGEGRLPGRGHALQLAGKFDINLKDATAIIDQVNAGVAQWQSFADAAGCTKKTTRAIAAQSRALFGGVKSRPSALPQLPAVSLPAEAAPGVGRNSAHARHRMCTEGWCVDDNPFWDRPRGDAYETYPPSLLLAACL